jgi:hypothetical protein
MLGLRILLASLILFSATFASHLAHASSDGKPATNCPNEYVDELREATQGAAQNLLGGGFRCKGNTTLEDIRRLECKSGVRNIGRTLTVTDDLDKISVRMFMQQLASNSHAQANCRLSFLSYYNSNTAEKARFNEAASKAFAAISDDLKTLTEYKAKLSSEYKQLQDRSMGDRAVGSLNAEGRADYEKKIAETDQELTKMLLGVPMGYDPDVARALADMGATGTFDARKFEAGMAAAVAKYQKASEYYDNKFTVVDKANGRGNYCLGIDYRNMAGDSGQMAKWADSLPAASPGEKLFKQNLTCRLDATYGIGRSRWNTTSAVVGFAAMVFPLTSGGAAVARSVQFAGRAGSLLGAGMKASAAVSALFAMDSLRQECFPSGAMVSGDRLKPGEKCDPKADFEKAIVEPNLLACGTGALMLGTVPLHIRNLIRGARALRAERKLASQVGNGDGSADNVEEIVVTGRRKTPATSVATSKTQQRLQENVQSGKIQVVKIDRDASGQINATPVSPDTVVTGRYYAVVELPDKRGLALAEYDSYHGGHTALARSMGVPVLRKLDRQGAVGGGVMFGPNGDVVISGKMLRYPDQQNADFLASAFRRMGFKVKAKTADGFSSIGIKETNPPGTARSSGKIHEMRTGP